MTYTQFLAISPNCWNVIQNDEIVAQISRAPTRKCTLFVRASLDTERLRPIVVFMGEKEREGEPDAAARKRLVSA